jgi:hypothetical protein
VRDEQRQEYLVGVIRGWFRVGWSVHKSPCFSDEVAEHSNSKHPFERSTSRFAQSVPLL